MDIINRAKNLEEDRHGIWTVPAQASVSYPSAGNRECFQLEDRSFWFNHRNDIIAAVLKRYTPPGPILDIGGGNGYVTRRLLDEGYEAALLEPGPDGALNAKIHRRIPEVIRSTLEEANFQPGTIAAAGLFDVLEHIEDDREFMNRVHEILKPGGQVYGTVPAFPFLWAAADIAAGHFRRYNRHMLRRLLLPEFEILYITNFFAPLTVPFLLSRSLPYRLGLTKKKEPLVSPSEHGTGGGVAVRLLRSMLAGEKRKIAGGKQRIYGTSCLFVAKKI